MKIRFFLTIITFLLIICITAVFIIPSGATEPEAAEPEALPCLNEQEHQWSDFVFTGEGLHSAECIRCGAVITENCVFSNEPSFLPEGDGTHSESCLICGGKRITPCQYREETVSPTEFEEGYTVHTCVLCAYSYMDERMPAEAAREQSGLMGDVDRSGIIEPGDARALLRCSVRLEALPTDRLPYADLDGDGVISPGDARLALRASVKLDPATRHAYEIEVTEQPDCEKDGALNCRCTYCGDSHVIVIPAFGHKYQ